MDSLFVKIKIFKPIFYLQVLGFLVIKGGIGMIYLIANQRISFSEAIINYYNTNFWGDLVFGVFLIAIINYFNKSGSK